MAWWHWLVLGFVLVVAELAVPAFFIVWFGIAALVVGLLAALLPFLSLSVQLVIWAILSIVMVVLWFRVFKQPTETRSGTADSITGEVGLLVRDVEPFHPGQVRFQRPILGSDMWDCVADATIKTGTRVRVLAVEGKTVRIVAA
ncbi:MAG TPA: NfeD family protein [Rhodocyclaceae bacterium]|nr:NfeD family protein [Rhodocyclaceae bacterium]